MNCFTVIFKSVISKFPLKFYCLINKIVTKDQLIYNARKDSAVCLPNSAVFPPYCLHWQNQESKIPRERTVLNDEKSRNKHLKIPLSVALLHANVTDIDGKIH